MNVAKIFKKIFDDLNNGKENEINKIMNEYGCYLYMWTQPNGNRQEFKVGHFKDSTNYAETELSSEFHEFNNSTILEVKHDDHSSYFVTGRNIFGSLIFRTNETNEVKPFVSSMSLENTKALLTELEKI